MSSDLTTLFANSQSPTQMVSRRTRSTAVATKMNEDQEAQQEDSEKHDSNFLAKSSPKTQLQMDLRTSLPSNANILAVHFGDPSSLGSLLNTLFMALPASTAGEVTTNPALAAQRRRLHGLLEAEKVYARDMTNASGERTGFLALPSEIRNEIYRLCLVFPGTECRFETLPGQKSIRNSRKLISIISNDFMPNIALLRTCKEVHKEAIEMFYGANTFASHRQTGASWSTLFQAIGGHRRLIRRVQIGYGLHFGTILSLLSRMDIIFDKIVVQYDRHHLRGYGADVNGLSKALKGFVRRQNELVFLSARATSKPHDQDTEEVTDRNDHDGGERDEIPREKRIKLLEVLDLGALAPQKLEKVQNPSFDEMAKTTESVYDNIAIDLHLIQEGETLKEHAKSNADIRGWMEGEIEKNRKRLVRASFGLKELEASDASVEN